jgi:hypothetical protein
MVLEAPQQQNTGKSENTVFGWWSSVGMMKFPIWKKHVPNTNQVSL